MKPIVKVLTLAFAVASVFAQAGEVSLLKVQTRLNLSRQPNYAGRFEALVNNLGYQKQVAIHIKQKDGTWTDVPLTYNRPADNGREVWAANYSSLPTDADELEFAVKYQVNGQTYWDSNNGANYRSGKISGTQLFGTNVYDGEDAGTASVGDTFYGDVTLKNLGYNKQVNVLFSTDDWASSKTVSATYDPNYWAGLGLSNPNPYGFEEWRFQLPVGSASKVAYAISYTVNGQTYWDNNFGRNYQLRLTH